MRGVKSNIKCCHWLSRAYRRAIDVNWQLMFGNDLPPKKYFTFVWHIFVYCFDSAISVIWKANAELSNCQNDRNVDISQTRRFFSYLKCPIDAVQMQFQLYSYATHHSNNVNQSQIANNEQWVSAQIQWKIP